MTNTVNFCGYRLEQFSGEGNTGSPIYTSITATDSKEFKGLGYITLGETTQNAGWGYGALYGGFIDSTGASTKLTSFWATFEVDMNNTTLATEANLVQYSPVVIRNSSSNTYLHVKASTTTLNTFRILLSTSLTDTSTYKDTGITFPIVNSATSGTNTISRISINVTNAGTSSGTITVYSSGKKMGTWTGDMTSYTDFDQISFHKATPTDNTNFYYAYVTDYATRYSYLDFRNATKYGTSQDWVGDFTTFATYPVNYYTIGGLYATEASQVVTFGYASDFTSATGYVPASVVFSSSVITDADSTVATVAGVVKNSTTSSVSYTRTPTADGNCFSWYYGSDPIASADWTLSTVNAYEFGIERVS